MQDVVGLGLFSFATGSFLFEKCVEHDHLSDVVSLLVWILLPLVTIYFLVIEHDRTNFTTALLVSNLFVISFYISFLRSKPQDRRFDARV